MLVRCVVIVVVVVVVVVGTIVDVAVNDFIDSIHNHPFKLI